MATSSGKGPGRGRPGTQQASHARAAKAMMERRQQQRRQLVLAGGASIVVIAVVVVLVAVKLSSSGTSHAKTAPANYSPVPAPASIVSGLADIPTSSLAAAAKTGAGRAPKELPGQPPLVSGGMPQVLYIGAEYCPFCAAERWAMVTALSKFGTFTALGQTTSSSTDVHPDTATFSFYQSAYTSRYVSFEAVEETTSDPSVRLQTPTAEQERLFKTYGNAGGSIPFIDLGNRWTIVGATYDQASLDGKTLQQIGTAATDSGTRIGQGIQAAAGLIVADLCKLTNGQPGDVCSAIAT